MISDQPLFDQPREGGAIELPVETQPRATLSLGWRRNG
jgi:hypothetical protein